MIQDYSNTFVGRQMVRVRQVPLRGNDLVKRLVATVVVGALLVGVAASTVFGVLIRSGLSELSMHKEIKLEAEKERQALTVERKALLDQSALALSAGKLGLYRPEGSQVRRL